ncbi:MAG TPA: DUF1800 domain-containing protein [Steroidobacteraceae bacterium]|nr:DUF1800 domain-containing protein [Steroidobacteraceae bacterium]
MVKSTVLIAAQRFGLGARPGDLGKIGDARGWLEHQVSASYKAPPETAQLTDSATILAAYVKARKDRRDAKKDGGDPVKQVANTIREEILPHYLAQVEARTRIAATTEQPFRERLVYFWTNHFAVSVDKPVVSGIAGSFENEAIRPHVTGHFADLLLAVEQHPAMITYLDNEFSIGPNSKLAALARRRPRAANRKVDINENLGREILELHTLGVDGGYTQADVTSFAKVLTGWSVGGGEGRLAEGKPGAWHYRDNAHEPGTHTVLGAQYKESGESQGKAVLHDLARHPSTARHLATKLARHFIADDPPAESVDRIAKAYTASDGNLKKVYAALIAEDAAWNPAPAKYKTPYEFVTSSLRALAIEPPEGRKLVASCETLGQRTYSPGSPAGWPDTARDWDGADALMKRVEWSLAFADRTAALRDARQVASDVLGDSVSPATARALGRAESNSQALALLLMSPEFQRR